MNLIFQLQILGDPASKGAMRLSAETSVVDEIVMVDEVVVRVFKIDAIIVVLHEVVGDEVVVRVIEADALSAGVYNDVAGD